MPDDAVLSKRLSRLVLTAFYGDRFFGPLASVQANIIEKNVMVDLQQRLQFYEEARERSLLHTGAIFYSQNAESGEVLGFIDVGLSLFDTRRRNFNLPRRADALPIPGQVPMPYLSNLAVDARARRKGVGRQLVEACEAEARRWGDDGAHPHLWLEASLSNQGGLRFYERLGYERVETTSGREVVRRRWSFETIDVQRALMQKSLLT